MICVTFVPLSHNTSDQVPSSPGSGSSSSKLIIHSQSFSSSGPHSQRESTRSNSSLSLARLARILFLSASYCR
ncbi:hypothetical protein EYF80_051728 [Liparis tanakae]|uniref:Uncharacterized protein n=1 Tax=Liparis tanakae TaxID=230148 RepID=A0A4Z2FBF8_9TELE|nr:hypothetical protein EYF80_051728 [Liparis tanakae]